jgi:cellulose synthase/poly-beta-1,6-N-acetylglucosamine synthase-like glycosyltransferase
LEGSSFNIPNINVLNTFAQVSWLAICDVLTYSTAILEPSLLASSLAWAIDRKGKLMRGGRRLTVQVALEVQDHDLLLRPSDHIVSWSHSIVLILSMLVCAVLCTIQAVKNIADPVFARMVISLASTYGVYIVSSLLALDPWYVQDM